MLELSPKSEGEDPDIIRQSIVGMMPGAEVFVPACVTQIGGDRMVHYLVDGYAFVRVDRKETDYLKLEGTRYVQTVLSNRQVAQLAYVSTSDIDTMRRKMQVEVDQGIRVGDEVMILSGPYRDIAAKVVEEIPEQEVVQVHVKLRSKEAILPLPRSFLRIITRAERAPVKDRVAEIRAWLNALKILQRWPEGALPKLASTYTEFRQLTGWADSGYSLYEFISSFERPLDFKPVRRGWGEVLRIDGWLDRCSRLWALIAFASTMPGTDPIRVRWRECLRLIGWQDACSYTWGLLHAGGAMVEAAELAVTGPMMEWVWLCNVADRLATLSADLDRMSVEIEEVEMIDHVVVDGHNLAFRCLYAPGISGLADSKGRPTGVVVGVLNSLAAMRKRFPGATITVCWDGSSQRRRLAFDGYKANREPKGRPVLDQIEFLKGLLPLLGVVQAHNPEEEADDVIGAVVKGRYGSKRVVVVSTDRDFLQLVSPMVVLLVPSTGASKEVLYDHDAVVREYGVPPDRMVTLRAMVGDNSDNIPGVAHVPTKTLASLVRSYGSIDGVFSSGFPGLTKAQYNRLKEAQAQVRLNVGLMTIRTDVAVTIADANVDQTAATQRLQDVEVNPERVVPAFLDVPRGFVKES